MVQKAKGFFRKKRTQNIMKRRLDNFKMDRIGLCDSSLAKRMLEKQTPIDMNPDR